MSMGPGRSGKHADHGNSEVKVNDHKYFGNVCSGFGGELICEHFSLETGEQCGLDPYQHTMNKSESATIF